MQRCRCLWGTKIWSTQHSEARILKPDPFTRRYNGRATDFERKRRIVLLIVPTDEVLIVAACVGAGHAKFNFAPS